MIKKESIIGTAGGNSLRVGIPETIVDLMQLKRGDKVNWICNINEENGNINVCFEKIKS